MNKALALAVAITAPTFVSAQPVCLPKDVMKDELSLRYGESVKAEGFSKSGYILRWWGDDSDGGWTVTIERSDGFSCIVDSGTLFEAMPAGSPT